MKNLAGALVEELWRQHFVAYEDALAAFYGRSSRAVRSRTSSIEWRGCVDPRGPAPIPSIG
ncbi:MAG TPA: hypothetical protein VLI71_01620 [Gammaproteobacteria bacterium]|nr:hypothetical protein [Gammaproteobacteria bacterium]